LRDLDPEAAVRLHPHDTHRVLRALETLQSSGRSIFSHQREHGFSDSPYTALKIGLHLDRQTLYHGIDQRVEAMLAAGLVAEVQELLRQGYSPDLKAMQALGYRQVTAYLDGRISREECVQTIKREHRRYAKRQLTWFRADPEIIWYPPEHLDGMRGEIERFLA
jgi:tRNA dimethylallyltransferase